MVGVSTCSFFKIRGDLAGAVAAGAHGEYPADDGRCFIIYRQLLCFRILDVAHKALWSPAVLHAPPWLSAPPGSSAGISNKPLVEQVFERHEVIALAAVSVYIVIDSDVAYAEHGKAFLNVETGMKLVTSQSGKVLGDDDSNLTVLHVGNHLLKCGPLEISTGKTVIHIEAGIGKVMVFCKLLQDIFLILNAVGIALTDRHPG